MKKPSGSGSPEPGGFLFLSGRAAESSAPTGGWGGFYQPPWNGSRRRSRLAARQIAGTVIGVSSGMGTFVPHPPSPGYSRKGPGPLPGFRACGGKKLDHFSRRRVRRENTSRTASVENGRPHGAAIWCTQSACSFIRQRQQGCLWRGNSRWEQRSRSQRSFIFSP